MDRTAKEELGIQFLAGFETEFILTLSSSETSPTGAPLPVNPYGWNESKAARSGTLELAVMEEICECLLKMGVEVLYWHAEAAPGQFEIVTAPLRPVQAVDCVVMTREVMYDVAQRYGLRATLAPRVFDSAPGSAAHVHISLSPTPSSPLPSSLTLPTPSNPYSLSSLEASFLQGILDHLPASCAFTLGAPQSYERVKDGIWSGGTWVCWGRDNKECPVRLCGSPPRPSNPSSFQPSSGTSGSSSTATTTATTTYEDGGDGGTINVTGAAGAGGGGWNLEVKCSDGTGNPYLALASLLASGILGIKSLLSSQSSSTSSQSLSINPSSPSSSSSTAAPSPPSSQLMEESLGQASSLPETTRQKMGIVQKLPTSFSEALKALEEDRELGGMLGEELVRSYAAVTRFRAERLEKLSLNELVDRF
ncbi:glutamine synthetase/guanido kinase [Sistotremastrum suecicum HHB10207 ss-3]|uniref:Glutamine synthetase/guanido kinase n=1 Tax=Sistotremastrum suecicum HHB10207 ss-3 TaxID=1314776 RepID=A0A165XHK0_9AGAM|nr:glutamine synthetase/guanido kinase [Sistotremastrum suecicum HHB10207 ss-3]